MLTIGIDGNEANVANRVGSNQYAYELMKAVQSAQRKEHRYVIYLRDQPLKDMPEAGENWQYRVIKPKKFWTQFRLPLDLYFHRPQPEIFFTPGHYAPRISPIPNVISIMDLGYLKFPQQFTKKDLYQLINWTKRSIMESKHIFAISKSTKNAIIRAYKIPEEKITVTYPGYDKSKFNPPAGGQKSKIKIDEIKKKYGIEGKYILFLSTLKPNKNVEGLIQAFKLLNNFDLKLVIAGKKGWLFESIFKKVKDLELEKRVVFTDFVPDDDVSFLMSGAEVFVLPSFWEGFGIPVLEAMACGTPVVVSNAGSLPEIVEKAGAIVDPYKVEEIAKGIKEVLENRNFYIEKGFEQVKKFSWEKCAMETLEVLNKIKYGNI